MERLRIEPRPNWTREVEALGFDFYTIDGVPYWGEDACYRFTAAEVDIIEEAANKLHKLCLYAVQRIVDMRPRDDDQGFVWEKMYNLYKERRYRVCGLDPLPWPPKE